jgi:hypothetical protein
MASKWPSTTTNDYGGYGASYGVGWHQPPPPPPAATIEPTANMEKKKENENTHHLAQI